MRLKTCFALLCLSPSLAFAGEPTKGTVIMISSVSGWLLLSSGFLLWKEFRKSRASKNDDPSSKDYAETSQ
jgi:hypothetical protein